MADARWRIPWTIHFIWKRWKSLRREELSSPSLAHPLPLQEFPRISLSQGAKEGRGVRARSNCSRWSRSKVSRQKKVKWVIKEDPENFSFSVTFASHSGNAMPGVLENLRPLLVGEYIGWKFKRLVWPWERNSIDV